MKWMRVCDFGENTFHDILATLEMLIMMIAGDAQKQIKVNIIYVH